jgi:hypothetical protein
MGSDLGAGDIYIYIYIYKEKKKKKMHNKIYKPTGPPQNVQPYDPVNHTQQMFLALPNNFFGLLPFSYPFKATTHKHPQPRSLT